MYPPQNILDVCLSVGVSGEDIYAHYPAKRDGRKTHVVECLLPYTRVLAVVLQLFKHPQTTVLVMLQRYDGEMGYDRIELDNEVGYSLTFDVLV